jgi:hypothetical protein
MHSHTYDFMVDGSSASTEVTLRCWVDDEFVCSAICHDCGYVWQGEEFDKLLQQALAENNAAREIENI